MAHSVNSAIDEQFKVDVIAAIPHLRRYAWSLVGRYSGFEADDLVQMAVERGLSKAGSYRPTSPVRVWLLTILHNLHVDRIRQSQREARVVMTVASATHNSVSSTDGDNPMDKAAIHDIANAVNNLPQEQRQVIMLVGLEGLRYADAAQVLGIPVGTVRSRLSRGREALRVTLDAPGHRQAN